MKDKSLGHEVLAYCDRHVLIRDNDLWALRHFLLTEGRDSAPDDLVQFVSGWQWIGPGVFLGIDLDDFFLLHPECRHQFVILLEATKQLLITFGTEIPLNYLQTHFNTVNAYYIDAQPTCHWIDCIDRFLSLFPDQ